MSDELRFLCPKCGQTHGVTWDSIVRHCRAVAHVEFDKKGRIRKLIFFEDYETLAPATMDVPAFDALSTQELAAMAYNKRPKTEPRLRVDQDLTPVVPPFPMPEEGRS